MFSSLRVLGPSVLRSSSHVCDVAHEKVQQLMKKILYIILLLMPALAVAGDITIANDSSGKERVDSISVKATHISVDLTADTDEDNLIDEWVELNKFQDYIRRSARNSGNIVVERVATVYNGRGKGGVFSSYGPASSYRIRLFAGISENESTISALTRLDSFVKNLDPPGDLDVRSGEYSLAFQNTESYSSLLLEKISKRIDVVKKALGEGYKARIDNLSEKVMVEQNGEDSVALYYNYNVSYYQKFMGSE